MTPELTIIIVNWNGEKFLPDCLRSIAKNPPGISYEVILIDNASSDGSVAWLKSDEAKDIVSTMNFKLIESDENLGFGRANNIIIEQTQTPFVFLLNPDTIVRPGAIDGLLEALRADEKIGVTVPRLLHADGSLQPSVWASPNPLTLLCENIFYRVLPKSFYKNWLYGPHWDYAEKRSVPLVCAAAMMIRRSVIDKVGAFDEDFHMYGEDLELAKRIVNNGWDLYFVPESEIHHLYGQSSMQRWTSVEKQVTMVKAFILFQKKSLPTLLVFLNVISMMFVYLIYLFANILQKDEFARYRKLVNLQIKTLRSFLNGKANILTE